MGLLSTIRSRPKRIEATTDDSQRSASSWRNTLKMLHRSRKGATAVVTNKLQEEEMQFRNSMIDDDKGTDSDADVFQTLMSNSVTGPAVPPSNSAMGLISSNNRNILEFWHNSDPNFLPTAYPLTRTDPRSHPQAKWGSLNLAASAALLAEPLKKFNAFSDKHPRFRFGPRIPLDDGDDRSSRADSTVSSRSRSAIEICTPKYAYISQDGKLVERELRNWPKPVEPKLVMRYKLAEPYATNYGKKSVRRARSLSMRAVLPRHRFIYERPIFIVPRAIVNENKRRLLARHMLKERMEPPLAFPLPNSVSLQESEQCKRYIQYQQTKYIKETEERVAYVEKMRLKAETPQSHA